MARGEGHEDGLQGVDGVQALGVWGLAHGAAHEGEELDGVGSGSGLGVEGSGCRRGWRAHRRGGIPALEPLRTQGGRPSGGGTLERLSSLWRHKPRGLLQLRRVCGQFVVVVRMVSA